MQIKYFALLCIKKTRQQSKRKINNDKQASKLIIKMKDSLKVFLLFYIRLNLVENQMENEKDTNLIYILIWTDPTISPFMYMGTGQEYFTNK